MKKEARKPKEIAELSVFFPAFNEEAQIENTVNKAKDVLNKSAEVWEVIVVNDGSTDKTKEVAERLSRQDARIKVVSHRENRGYGASLKTGFHQSKYAWLAFTDSDGQFDFSEISKFIRKQKQTAADLVIGYYQKRKVSLGKRITTRVWELLVFLLFGLSVKDIDCGFKLISKKVVEATAPLESERGAFISSEFLIKAKKLGFRIEEVGVSHYPRRTGQGTGRNLNVIISSFIDLMRLWRKLR